MRPAILILPILIVLLGGCDAENGRLPGYVEGEYVLIAPLASAQLLEVPVGRGDRVARGGDDVDMLHRHPRPQRPAGLERQRRDQQQRQPERTRR